MSDRDNNWLIFILFAKTQSTTDAPFVAHVKNFDDSAAVGEFDIGCLLAEHFEESGCRTRRDW